MDINFNFKEILREPATNDLDWKIIIDLENAHRIASKKEPNIEKLERYYAKYPHIPAFCTYLIAGLKQRKRNAEIEKYAKTLQEKFPDYLYGKIIAINAAIDKGELDNAWELLGEVDLQKKYPNKTAFHIDEITKYYYTVFDLLLKSDRDDEAAEILENLTKIDALPEILANATTQLMQYRMGRLRESFKKLRKVEYVKPSTNYPTKLSLKNQELNILFEKWYDIEPETLHSLLSLERESLVEDLEHIVLYSIGTFSEETFDWKKDAYLIHALFLLIELQSEKSLPVILEILRQDRDFAEYWFGDDFDDFLWEPIAFWGNNKLQELFDFMKEPNLDAFHRSCVSGSLLQMIHYFPEKKQELEQYYKDLLEFLIENNENNTVIDATFIGMLISNIFKSKFESLRPQIKQLFDLDVVDNFICGDYEHAVKYFSKEPKLKLREKYSLEEKYEVMLNSFVKTEEENSDNDYDNRVFDPPQKQTISPKIGRNEPCPCGSGKKYKKCCGNE